MIFGLYMIGKNEDEADLTLLFSCEHKGPRRRAIKLAKDEELLKAFPFIKLAKSSRPPLSLEVPIPLASSPEESKANEDDYILPSNDDIYIYCLPKSHICGTVIVHRSEIGPNPVRTATLGGIICF